MAKTIGNIIRELRCARNLTQEQLAENLNITAQAISKWENNIGMPDISQVLPIAHFFGVSTDVLFGIDNNMAIDEVQELIDNATSQESYKKEYKMLKQALQNYPGDTRLLLELLSCGVCLLSDGDLIKGADRNIIFEECERSGRLIFSYSKDLSILLECTEWMIKLYCEVGENEKAAALSETLPSYIGFNKEAALGRIYENCKVFDKAIESYTVNISQFQRQLIHTIVLCGNAQALNGDNKQAVQLYSLAITISQDFLNNNPISTNKSLQNNLIKTIERCKRTITKLNQ